MIILRKGNEKEAKPLLKNEYGTGMVAMHLPWLTKYEDHKKE